MSRDMKGVFNLTGTVMIRLARVYEYEGKYAEAKETFKAVLADREKEYGPDNGRLLSTLRLYKDCLQKAGETNEAAQVEERIKKINASTKSQLQSSPEPVEGTARIPFRRDE